jgi:hypothetical protein
MGYIRHNAIVVTCWDKTRIAAAHGAAERCLPGLVSSIVDSHINGYHSFLVAPDGSKEGWSDSDKGDAARAEFISWLESQRYEDNSTPFEWVEIAYGSDDRRRFCGTSRVGSRVERRLR